MKKLLKFLILIFVATLFTLCFSACNKVESIVIKDADMPQLVYVLGQDLNLDDAFITLNESNGSRQLSLQDQNVSLSGYNPNKEGKQEITVTYKEFQTKFVVTVYPRMVAENVASYFVGDEFNPNKGRLKITKDNGERFVVDLNDERLSLSGFSSDTESLPLLIEATYSNDGEVYVGTFGVNVYEVKNVLFTSPNKISYFSSDSGIDLVGGRFTFKSEDGKLTRYIELTEDMISGFDLSAATEANMETPLEQTITVTYANVSKTFNIKITYSKISLIKEKLDKFISYDWSGETLPNVSSIRGEMAIEVFNLYNGLSNKEKALLTKEEKLLFVRPAIRYGLEQWETILDEYSNTFVVDNGIKWTCNDYTLVKLDYENLSDPTSEINLLASMVVDILAEFGQEILYADQTIEVYSKDVFSLELLNDLKSRVNYLISLYDLLKDIPKGWTEANIYEYEEDIIATMALIKNSNYVSFNDAVFVDIVSGWLNNNFIDIFYEYFYAKNDAESINVLKNLRLPNKLETLYTYIFASMSEISALSQGIHVDTTSFMLYYDWCNQLIVDIKDDNNQMYNDLYANLTFDNIFTVDGQSVPVSFDDMMHYLETTTFGYLYNIAVYENPAIKEIWDKYINVLNLILSNNSYENSTAYEADIKEIFEYFVNMTPSLQHAFLSSLHAYYPSNSLPLVLDVEQTGMFSMFVQRVAFYYYYQLPEGEARQLFVNLLSALEYYSMRSLTPSAMESFANVMQSVKTTYVGLQITSPTNLAIFDNLLGYFYDKYVKIYDDYVSNSVIEIGEYKAQFDALADAITKVDVAATYISNKNNVWSLFFSSCELAFDLSNKLLQDIPQDIMYAYCNKSYVKLVDGRTVPLDYGMYYVESIYTTYIRVYDLYKTYCQNTKVRQFLLNINSFLWTTIDKTINGEQSTATYVVDDVLNIMNEFLKMSNEDRMNFMAIDTGSLYKTGLEYFFDGVMTKNAAETAKKLVSLQYTYSNYIAYPEGTYSDGVTTISRLRSIRRELVELYVALQGEDKSSFNDLLETLYEEWIALYDAANIPELT